MQRRYRCIKAVLQSPNKHPFLPVGHETNSTVAMLQTIPGGSANERPAGAGAPGGALAFTRSRGAGDLVLDGYQR